MASPFVPTEPASLNIGLVSFDRVTAEMRKAAPGLTAEHMQTFIAVARGGRPSQTEISSLTGFTRQSTSRHVAKLVSSGLLVQRRDHENGRRRVLRLTALGRFVSATLSGPVSVSAGVGGESF